jgi:hypothetical protein
MEWGSTTAAAAAAASDDDDDDDTLACDDDDETKQKRGVSPRCMWLFGPHHQHGAAQQDLLETQQH